MYLFYPFLQTVTHWSKALKWKIGDFFANKCAYLLKTSKFWQQSQRYSSFKLNIREKKNNYRGEKENYSDKNSTFPFKSNFLSELVIKLLNPVVWWKSHFFCCWRNVGCVLKGLKHPNTVIKFPHTGDTKSLDRCGE